jgi:photosystem II stability/assembly factor-like uncharacterized protein
MMIKVGEAPGTTRVKPVVWWFALAAATLILGAAGLFQAPRSDPFQVITPWTSADWWRYPIEQNAFKRLPVISGSLNHIFALPDGQNVWAVGSGGLIVHSADGGKTWEQQADIQINPLKAGENPPAIQTPAPNVTPQRPVQERRPEGQKASQRFDLIPSAYAGEPPAPRDVANTPPQRPTPRSKLPENYSPQNQDYAQPPTETSESLPERAPRGAEKQGPPVSTSVDGPVIEPSKSGAIPSPAPSLTVASVDLKSIYFTDARNGWVVGHRGTILATADGGNTWKAQNSTSTAPLRSVHFSDASRGWAVGNQGVVLATADGGKTWMAQTSGTAGGLYSVYFSDVNHGWAVGGDIFASGVIIATLDGGKNWTKQTSRTQGDLSSVHFIDSSQGWAVGRDGAIVATIDGGKNWAAQTSGAQADLSSVYFSDADRGWAVGGNLAEPGTIVTTADGGKTWTVRANVTDSGLKSIHFSDANHGWAVGDMARIVATDDGGKSWTAQTLGSQSWLNAVHFADAGHGWAVGERGTILNTTDGGAAWIVQASGSRAALYGVHFSDATQGWAVGEAGAILATVDGGKTWNPQSSGTQAWLSAVYFSDARNGWTVGAGAGAILATDNGGKTWVAQTSGVQRRLQSVHFIDANYGWAVGAEGIILATDSGGKSWIAQNSGSRAMLNGVYFADPRRGWAVGDRTVLATTDGGKSWTAQTSASQAQLNGVRFVDVSRGWAVGDAGTILATDNGGTTWTAQRSGISLPLNSISAMADGQHLFAVGAGTIQNSRDGGKTWQSIDYRRYPAPWAWLAWLFSALAGWRAWRRVHSALPLEKERNIEDKAASDSPVEKGDQDRLNFEPVAKALGKFLQNQSTTAPLVLAVTGKWGTGKSSLMNLLRGELRNKFRVRSVWFNAWHHQNEENLLAALLENIRQQAVPPLYSPEGWLFRAQLACARYKRRFVSSSLWLAIFAAAIGYICVAPNAGWTHFVEWIRMLTSEGDKLDKVDAWSGVSGIALIVVAVKVLLSLRAFGVNPAALMATTANQFKLRDASAQAGFRFQFQREFEEVTTSLERIDKRMLIFIDDLDRCQPDKVIQVLEAVNFLTSSGKCYIVLGMDRDYVERAVGLSFEKIAQEIAEQKSASDHADGKLQRQQFAQRYMKKLVNLEIPIPSLDPVLAETLFNDASYTESRGDSGISKIVWRGQAMHWLLAQVRWLPVAVVLLIAGGAWFGGSILGEKIPPASEAKKESASDIKPGLAIQWEIESKPDGKMLIVPKVIGESKESEKMPAVEPIKPTPPALAGPDQPREKNAGPAVLEAGQTARPLWMLPLSLLLVLGGLLVYALLRSLDAVVRDSEAFNQALNIWKRLVIAKSANPREIKRFQNRVRYFAMRLRDDRERKVVSQETQQTEAMLVALAALHHTETRLVGHALLFQDTGSTKPIPVALTTRDFPALDNMAEAEKQQLFDLWGIARQCLNEHRTAGLQWPPTAEVIERFKRWSDGIVT